MDISEILTLIILFFIGAILGSFACCQAWRIRLKQLNKKDPGKWSVCLSCGARLKASENIPVFSWLAQRGKCKHCGVSIGKTEILAEISLGIVFVLLGGFFYPEIISALSSTTTWYLPMLISIMVLVAITITIMWILIIYDAKWQELPVRLLVIVNFCAVLYAILRAAGQISSSISSGTFPGEFLQALPPLLGAVAILAGTYFLLYFFSREKLVGSGDWLIALPIALILGHWWLALVVLFLSNLLGSVFGVFQKLHQKKGQIPFGPFLVVAFIVVYVSQSWLLSLIASL